jgi:putative membrane protein
MSDQSKPRSKPYEAAADRVTLTPLPGDAPEPEASLEMPPPQEFALGEVSLVAESPDLPAALAAPRKRRSFWSLGTAFSLSLTLFALGFLGYESIRAVLDALRWWAPSGVLLGLLLAGVVVTGILAIGREFGAIRRQLRTLGRIEVARQESDQLLLSRGHDRGLAFVARVIGLYDHRPELAPAIREFRQSMNSSLRDYEVVARLSIQVLSHLDERAREAVGRAMRDTAFISLASPNGLIDSLITLWRELKMLREIGMAYGLAPGLIQQWTLLRRVLSIAATSGLVNQAGDMAVQSLGGGLVGRLSANAADSLYTALRTARLGLYAIETCRPVALQPEERRGMWTLLRKAAFSVRSLLDRGAGGDPPPTPDAGRGSP